MAIVDLEVKIKELASLDIATYPQLAIQFTDEPKFPQYYSVPIKTDGEVEDDSLGHGLATDNSVAKIKSIAEAIERYSLDVPTLPFIRESFNDLKEEAINPKEFINFSGAQLKGKKKEYESIVQRERLQWVEGTNHSTNKKVYLPMQLVYVDGLEIEKEPLLREPISTGAAFEFSEERAINNGLLECIERDAFMLAFLRKKPLKKVTLDSADNSSLKKYFERYHLEPCVFDITTDIGIPVFMGLLFDRTGIGPAVTIGAKAGFYPETLARDCLLEAQQIRTWLRQSYVRDGKPQIKKENISSVKDRAYYWCDTKNISKLEFWFDDESRINLSNIPTIKKADQDSLVKYLQERGLNVYTVDITPPKLSKTTAKVIKSIVPQLHPLYLSEKCKYLYSRRLGEVDDSSLPPHPFL